MDDRRANSFTQKLSLLVLLISGFGGLYVLADPVFTLMWWGQKVQLGGEGFSEQLKGAVVQTLLIGGWSAVLMYWIGASASGAKQQESISRIAEGPSVPVVTPAEIVPAAVAEVVKPKGKK